MTDVRRPVGNELSGLRGRRIPTHAFLDSATIFEWSAIHAEHLNAFRVHLLKHFLIVRINRFKINLNNGALPHLFQYVHAGSGGGW